MRKLAIAIVCGLVSTTLLLGCTRALPLISHAHVGHSLTSWRDTPGQQGLFVVAETEVATALNEARQARRAADEDPAGVQAHIVNVIHALDPDRSPSEGTGTGYGALRSIEGATEHMVFAAGADDASENLIAMTQRFAEGTAAVRERMLLAVRIAELVRQANAVDYPKLTRELEATLDHVSGGKDVDGDGRISEHTAEVGLVQLRDGISRALNAEDPAYHPIGRHYLLGLIRLPDGSWAYRFDQSDRSTASGDSSY